MGTSERAFSLIPWYKVGTQCQQTGDSTQELSTESQAWKLTQHTAEPPFGEASDHQRQHLLPCPTSSWCIMKYPGKRVHFQANNNKYKECLRSLSLTIQFIQTQCIGQWLNEKAKETMKWPKFSNSLLLPQKSTIFFHRKYNSYLNVKYIIKFRMQVVKGTGCGQCHQVSCPSKLTSWSNVFWSNYQQVNNSILWWWLQPY